MDDKTTLIGVHLSGSGAQVTWFDETLDEPQTLYPGGRGEDAFISVPADAWKGVTRGRRFGMKSMTDFLNTLIHKVPALPELSKIRICVTVPDMTRETARSLSECLGTLGMAEKNIFLQDWKTSFFYYVTSMPAQLWKSDVAFLYFRDMKIWGSIFHIDRSGVPYTASIRETVSADVNPESWGHGSREDWDRERDRRFYELLGRLFERRSVSSSYLYGTYFDRSWAPKSFQYLTFRKHAFQGENIFSKGACYSLMARTGIIRTPDIIFSGRDMLTDNIGMWLRVRGKEQYHVLIPAGINWYEAHSEIEIIPENEKSVSLLSTPMDGGSTVEHIIRLDHFPKRQPRATRLRMTVFFSDPDTCTVEIEDMGFGEITPSSGRVWKRQVIL